MTTSYILLLMFFGVYVMSKQWLESIEEREREESQQPVTSDSEAKPPILR